MLSPLMKPPGQITVYLACAVTAGLASFGFDPATSARFSGFGGGLPPASMLALAILFGAPALWQLQRTGFLTARRRKPRLGRIVAVTLVFAAVSIAIDLAHPFPAGVNARFPQSLLFYPTIAVVAETAFHLVPLALVFGLTRRPVLSIVLVALAEPAFQVILGSNGTLHWFDMAVGLNIFAISLVQLTLFRRHGFAAMLGVRLVYYLWWHILWGEARIWILF